LLTAACCGNSPSRTAGSEREWPLWWCCDRELGRFRRRCHILDAQAPSWHQSAPLDQIQSSAAAPRSHPPPAREIAGRHRQEAAGSIACIEAPAPLHSVSLLCNPQPKTTQVQHPQPAHSTTPAHKKPPAMGTAKPP
jgi:hypothetical protein